jgi:hypothetical protein
MLLAGNNEGNGLVIHGDQASGSWVAKGIPLIISFVTDRKRFVKESLEANVQPAFRPRYEPKKILQEWVNLVYLGNEDMKNEGHLFYNTKFFHSFWLRPDIAGNAQYGR